MSTTRRPMTALRVSDLNASTRFYVHQIGCELVAQPERDAVATVEHQGYLILLAGRGSGDITPLLDSPHEILEPPSTVFLDGGNSADVHELRAALEARGLCDVAVTYRWWGDHGLRVIDPDGYAVQFWTTTERSASETLDLYESGVDVLDRALDGLTDGDLDRSPGTAEWTIRQIVHHLADTEASVLPRLKAALAEPGREWRSSTYLQDRWADGLAYGSRDIGPSVALFRAVRAHVVQLMRDVPDAWERATVGASGHGVSAGETVRMLMSHVFEHIEDIERIADGHQRSGVGRAREA